MSVLWNTSTNPNRGAYTRTLLIKRTALTCACGLCLFTVGHAFPHDQCIRAVSPIACVPSPAQPRHEDHIELTATTSGSASIQLSWIGNAAAGDLPTFDEWRQDIVSGRTDRRDDWVAAG